MDIRLIATGGTFDKVYDPVDGSLGFDTTRLPGMLADARLDPAPPLEVPMLVDSLEMTEAGRDAIVAACRAAPEPALVVVHGTDTMTDTARRLDAARIPKTIVLTGAMVPAAIEHSDAMFNLGAAIGTARLLPVGVWIVIGGRAHAWDAVRKNRAAGRFEPVEPGAGR